MHQADRRPPHESVLGPTAASDKSNSTAAPPAHSAVDGRCRFPMPHRRRFNLPSWPRLAVIAAALLLAVTAAAWLDREGLLPLREPAAPAPFADGDTVVFLGDSITQNGRYLSYLRAFYLTRFPHCRIQFVNAGIAGDTAARARRRLAWDVFPHHPTAVSLLFGMNDVQRGLYAPGAAQPDLADARSDALSAYRWNMEILARQLAVHSAPRLIFVTPTPYDDGAAFATVNHAGFNAALADGSASLRRLARKYDGSLVELHRPMSALNEEFQSVEPQFSIVGEDRIHPGAPGHLLIAYHFLKAQRVPTLVSDFALDGATGAVVRARNGRILRIDATPGRLVFDAEEAALPFPIDDEARAADGWLPIRADLNRQMLTVHFPHDARYRLHIDGEIITDFSAAELRAGVNLALLDHTPQMRRAQALLAEIEQCRLLEVQLRRYAQAHASLLEARVDPDSAAAVQAHVAAHLAALAPDERPYHQALFEHYHARRLTIDVDRAVLAARLERLGELNRPRVHRYEFARLAPPDEPAVLSTAARAGTLAQLGP